jgi:hypothetical protein
MIKKNDILLIVIFIVIGLSLVMKVVFHESGYISNDASNYLQLSKNLLDGFGIYVPSEKEGEGVRTLFSSWPVGYPLLIAVIAKITGFSVMVSSKILNFIFIGLTLLFFRRLFFFDAWVFALIFLFSSYIEISSWTWSETGFIFGLVMFSYYLYSFLNNKDNLYLSATLLLFSACFLFLIRYIGAYTIGVMGLMWIYLLIFNGPLEKRKIVILTATILLNIVFVVSYLYFNFLETGLTSGRERVFAPESNYELLVTLLFALLAEITIPVYHPRPSFLVPSLIIQFSLIGYFIYKNDSSNSLEVKSNSGYSISKIFFITGLLYLLCLVVVRWIFYFNEYSFRLLGPGTFMIFVAIISYLKERLNQKSFRNFKQIIVILTLISFILYVPIKTYARFEQPYNETLQQLNHKYEAIPSGSILAFETNKHLKYYRSDITIKKPLISESLTEFFNRVNKSNTNRVYVEIFDSKRIESYHESFINLFEDEDTGSIVEIFKDQ